MPERSSADQGLIGFAMNAWPLLALGVIGALLIRACVPVPVGPAAPGYDSQSAPRVGSFQAMAALSSLTPQSDTEHILEALNQLTIDFPVGSATLPESAEPVLAKVAEVLAERPASERFQISGHADGSGSPLADLELARRRAEAVVNYLVNQGVPTASLEARGIADPDTPPTEQSDEARLRNQRLEFALLP